jgi:hypothetical protein
MIPMPSDTLEIALDTLKAHPTWFLFPIRRLEKTPPCFKNELELASNDPAIIKKWHRTYLGCNWGIALKKSKLIVVDVDTKPGKSGQQTFDALELLHGPLPETFTIRTPSGGSHYYFNEANGVTHKPRVSGFGKDVDSTNYVLVPGCWLSNGGSYEVVVSADVAPSPEWFVEYLGERSEVESDQTPEIILDKPENISWAINYLQNDATPSLQGNNGEFALLLTAGELKDHGISESKAIELLDQYYNVFGRCDPLWSIGDGPIADRLDVKVRNAWSYLKKNAPGSATAEAEFQGDLLDDEQKQHIARLQETDAEAWRKAHPEPKFVDENGRREATPPPRLRAPMMPLDQIDDEMPIRNVTDICNRWVWVTGLKRFVNRSDPLIQWDTTQFDSVFNRYAQTASISKALFKGDRIQRFHYLAFRPGKPECSWAEYNVWRPGPVKPKAGDTSLWNEHINYLFQNSEDRDHVLNWCAWVLQNPTLKPNHALLIVGKNTGTGKSFVARVMEQLIGVRNTQRPKNSSMGGDFNSWLVNCRLCIIEEVMQVGRRENLNALRDLITEPRVEVNIKGVSAFLLDNAVAMMGISNHPNALPLDEHDRRWLVVETHVFRREPDYYKRLFTIFEDLEMLSAILDELLNRDLKGYSANIAAPMTEAKQQMIELSLSDAETWLIENSGNPPLSYNLVTIRDVVEAMPVSLQRTTRLSTVTIPTFLRDKLNGARLGLVRIGDGRREHLWALHGRADMIKQSADIGSVYSKQMRSASKTAEEEAADDFGV